MGLKQDELWALRLSDARKGIVSSLLAKTYGTRDLEALLKKSREKWRFPQTIPSQYFIQYLVKTGVLRRWRFKLSENMGQASYAAEKLIYSQPDANQFDVALGLRSNSYLSHLSASYLHGLTNLVPRVVYTNLEQAPKTAAPSTALQQTSVDQAFAKPARKSGFAYSSRKYLVVLLAGQHTNRLEIFDTTSPDGGVYPATSLERTLIDCTVRPNQAGGIHEVLAMYEAARDRVSVRRVKKILEQLGFAYPYRQAIGFLLERAGYSAKQVQLFESPEFTLDFYLEYAMPEREYSTRWRLHYPKGF